MSQNLVTLKEYLHLRTAGYQYHLYFFLICMGLRNLLNEIEMKEKKNQFLFQKSTAHQYFCWLYAVESQTYPVENVKLCKDILMFLWRVFSKALHGSGRTSVLRSDGISCCSLNIGSSCTDLWPELRKESDWPTSWWMLSYLFLKQSNSFCFLRQYYHYYLSCYNKNLKAFSANSIAPDLFKWTSLSFKCFSTSTVSVWPTKVILH